MKTQSELFMELYNISLSGANTESRLNKIIEKHGADNQINKQQMGSKWEVFTRNV